MSTEIAVFGSVRSAFEDWCDGNAWTHEHFLVDPTQFVGRVPAEVHRRAEQLVMALVPLLVDLVESLHEDSDCRFDHHVGCQEHGYLDLDSDECPNATARRLVAAWNTGREATS